MKILSVSFKNINSLTGSHTVNFADSEYEKAGLFLISGNTGSGKSTILDAITAALYARTPRSGKITNTSNSLMSSGTGEMECSVTFSEKGKSYLSRINQSRAHGRAGGKLQGVKAVVFDKDSGTTLSRTISEWENQIVSITGLSYDQFTKSVVLAQGDFASFLRLDVKERSDMLEKITGTEIYSRISIEAFSRARTENESLGNLRAACDSIETMTEDQHNDAIVRADNARVEIENKKAVISALEKAVAYSEKRKKLEILVPILESQRNDAEKKKKEFILSDEKFTKSENDKNAQERILAEADRLDVGINVLLSQLDNMISDEKKNEKALSDLKKDIESHSAILKRIKSEMDLACDYVEKNRKDANLRTVISSLNLLDNQLSVLKKKKNDAEKKRKQCESLVNAAFSERALCEEKLHESSEILEEAEKNLDSLINEKDEILCGRMPGKLEEDIDRLKDQQREELTVGSYEDARLLLADGDECPLCGSVNHPFCSSGFAEEHRIRGTELEKKLTEAMNLRAAFLDIEKKLSDAERNRNNITVGINKLNGNLDLASEKLENAQKMLMESVDTYRQIEYEFESCEKSISECAKGMTEKELRFRCEKYEAECRILNDSSVNFASSEEKLAGLIKSLDDNERRLSGLKNEICILTKTIDCRKAERSEVFLGDTNQERKRIQDVFSALRTERDRACREKDKAEALYIKSSTTAEDIRSELESIERDGNEYITRSDVTVLLENAKTDLNAMLGNLGALNALIENDTRARNRKDELERKIISQESICSLWNQLQNLIGSADGKKFRRYVQAYSFRELVKAANARLKHFSDRYILVPDSENELDFCVIDNENDGNIRTARCLSGGETFLVSLSLALGLSSFMARNTSIESFFLDEGFGTLDENNLGRAVDALLSLREEGKTIGIITHVRALIDSIPVQIKVGGKSVISGPGVS